MSREIMSFVGGRNEEKDPTDGLIPERREVSDTGPTEEQGVADFDSTWIQNLPERDGMRIQAELLVGMIAGLENELDVEAGILTSAGNTEADGRKYDPEYWGSFAMGIYANNAKKAEARLKAIQDLSMLRIKAEDGE